MGSLVLSDATRIINVIDSRIAKAVGSGAGLEVTYGKVAQLTGNNSLSAYLYGDLTHASAGFRIRAGLNIQVGDRARVTIDARGARWIDEVILPTPYAKVELDPIRGRILAGNGSVAPVIGALNNVLTIADSAGTVSWQALPAGLTLGSTVTSVTTYGQAASAGSATTASKSDHAHGSVPLPTITGSPYLQNPGGILITSPSGSNDFSAIQVLLPNNGYKLLESFQNPTDTYPVYKLLGFGENWWGPGGGTDVDTVLKRMSSGVVGTTGKLTASGATPTQLWQATASATTGIAAAGTWYLVGSASFNPSFTGQKFLVWANLVGQVNYAANLMAGLQLDATWLQIGQSQVASGDKRTWTLVGIFTAPDTSSHTAYLYIQTTAGTGTFTVYGGASYASSINVYPIP